MPYTSTTKQIIETIREKSHNSEPLKEFLVQLFTWELKSKGSYIFKETYKQMIKSYSQKLEEKDED